MNIVRWLHLSDIHFNLNNEECIDARDCLPKYIESIINQKSDKLDFIVISGDCAYQNKAYDGIKEYLSRFIPILKDECKDNFFIVPGNHDIKRKVTHRTSLIDSFYINDIEDDVIDNRLYPDGKIDSVTYNLLSKELSEDFIKFYEDVINEKYNMDKICTIKSLNDVNKPVNLIHINTCLFSYDRDNDPDKKGKLLLDTRGIKNELSSCKNLENHLNIAIGHHEIDCFYSKDRKKFEQLLMRFNIDLYLCGHTHVPENKTRKIKDTGVSIICTGAMTADGSEINISIGELSFEDGKGFIEHHKWEKELDSWNINRKVSRELNDVGQWGYFVKKFIDNPVVVKDINPLFKEIKQRYNSDKPDYFEKLEKFKKELAGIHNDKIGENSNCGNYGINRCQESEIIFSQLFRTTLNNGIQKYFFSREDILIITILIYSYNIFKYYITMNDSSIKGELGRIINTYTQERRLTDVCIEVLSACFKEPKFNLLPYNLSPIDDIVVHPKLLAVIMRFIDRLTCKTCLLCDEISDKKLYRKQLNAFEINFNATNKCIEITSEIDEDKAFTNKIGDRNLYRHIIDEIQNINDERMFFNSYCGHICLIENMTVNIDFINGSYGYDRRIHTIKDSISLINYNGFKEQNENHHEIFVQTYPNFDEQKVIEQLKKLKEE